MRDAHLMLTLGELILKVPDGQLRKLLVRQFPSVLGYLLVKACLQIEKEYRASPHSKRSGFNSSQVTKSSKCLWYESNDLVACFSEALVFLWEIDLINA